MSQKDVVITSDIDVVDYAIEKDVKLIIASNIDDIYLENALRKKVNIIKTHRDMLYIIRHIVLCNSISTLLKYTQRISFNENYYYDDFKEKCLRLGYNNYPIVSSGNICMGMIRITDLGNLNRKRVILVDHNEATQSVDGLEEADVLEIIDHHKIGSIATNNPINFRNMPVGSSSTIVALMFKENHIVIPKDIAGLLLSGIISDTLLFLSPTTTDIDRKVVDELSTICNVDYNEYGLEMFKAGSELKGKTEEEIYYTDFKNFTISGKKFGISQVSTISVNDIIDNKDKYIEIMNNLARNNDYDVAALFVTDILNNGSYIFYNEDSYEILDNCFSKDLKEGMFLDGVISRKKQIIPLLMEELK